MGYRFNPPPGWPPVPQGFTPPQGWQPDPSWPPAPPGWQLWVDDGVPAGAPFGSQRPRRGLRITRRQRSLITLAVVAVIAIGGYLVDNATSAHRSSTGQITKNGNLGVTSLRAGDCFQKPANATSGADFDQVTAVSCVTPHDAQVIATLPVSSSSYPGVSVFEAQAKTGCDTALKADVNQAALTQTMNLIFFYPDQNAWGAGQQSISCVVADTTPDLTSSLMK